MAKVSKKATKRTVPTKPTTLAKRPKESLNSISVVTPLEVRLEKVTVRIDVNGMMRVRKRNAKKWSNDISIENLIETLSIIEKMRRF